jgi:UDP-N-acetyl-D-glucosamine dehydrogenase
MSYYNLLKKKIISKKFKVGIIGLGYVGLPLAIRYLQSNIFVVGVD